VKLGVFIFYFVLQRLPSMRDLLFYIPTSQGGIRQVHEALFFQFHSRGLRLRRASSLRELVHLCLVSIIRNRCRPYAILALQCGFLAPLFNRSIYILHGFPVKPFYSPLRTYALILAASFARAFGSRLTAVSFLTKNIFQRIYGIYVDAVINNGVDSAYHLLQTTQKKRQILYLGRLAHNKGIEIIVTTFLALDLASQGYLLAIAGSGDLEGYVRTVASVHPSIHFLGPVTEEQKQLLYQESDIFVSLNDFEPFGVTYIEAAISGCKIIAPYSSGIIDYLPASCPFYRCDPLCPDDVRLAFGAAASSGSAPAAIILEHYRAFRYEVIAERYLGLLLA